MKRLVLTALASTTILSGCFKGEFSRSRSNEPAPVRKFEMPEKTRTVLDKKFVSCDKNVSMVLDTYSKDSTYGQINLLKGEEIRYLGHMYSSKEEICMYSYFCSVQTDMWVDKENISTRHTISFPGDLEKFVFVNIKENETAEDTTRRCYLNIPLYAVPSETGLHL
jgi:hypothetical protein